VSLPRAVLDADIIFSRVLHELMGRLGSGARLFDLVWSEELLGEAKASLIEHKGLRTEVAEKWVDHMRREFPDGRVDISEAPEDLDFASLTRDTDDIHVCTLAIVSNADYLFTFDRGYLSKPLDIHGIDLPDLDEFLVAHCEEQPDALLETVERQAAAWDGGHPVDDLLVAFERAGVPKFSEAMRSVR
jgi:predicted nucleic acid-binding protein